MRDNEIKRGESKKDSAEKIKAHKEAMGSKSFGNYCFYKRRQIKTIEPKDKKLAPPAGLEPATYGLTVHRSTD